MTAVTTGGRDLSISAGKPVTVVMRGTTSNPARTMFVYRSGAWAELHTFNAGCGNTFEAVSTSLGYFALTVTAAGGESPAPTSSSGLLVPLLVALLIVVTLFTVAGLLFLNRRPVGTR